MPPFFASSMAHLYFRHCRLTVGSNSEVSSSLVSLPCVFFEFYDEDGG